MNTTTALITLAIIAWILQIFLSWFQIRRFNNAFLAMQKGKYLGVGRSKGRRFQPRVLVALSFDENYNVIDSVLMKGLTVFALPKPIEQLHGMNLKDIDPKTVFPDQSACQSALEIALTINKS
ncbi:transcriptional regulator GutM [Zophobihabitans entericus]|uniref:Transcriptional regulator GutM n=1 Tax=Zophobihabitans entericus TaxID=1635327 RepID=A0A6G9IBW3_9GAMM|nr:transcriptional regulator GutM [Zophobihabitans entericus]QIQ21070.1 transcriptional regulator GutM [Zophobihabitans entericus]